VIRVGADTVTAGGWDTVEAGAERVDCMMPGILMRLAFRYRSDRSSVSTFCLDVLLFSPPVETQ
jgi:hypothetical protein